MIDPLTGVYLQFDRCSTALEPQRIQPKNRNHDRQPHVTTCCKVPSKLIRLQLATTRHGSATMAASLRFFSRQMIQGESAAAAEAGTQIPAAAPPQAPGLCAASSLTAPAGKTLRSLRAGRFLFQHKTRPCENRHRNRGRRKDVKHRHYNPDHFPLRECRPHVQAGTPGGERVQFILCLPVKDEPVAPRF